MHFVWESVAQRRGTRQASLASIPRLPSNQAVWSGDPARSPPARHSPVTVASERLATPSTQLLARDRRRQAVEATGVVAEDSLLVLGRQVVALKDFVDLLGAVVHA